MISIICGTNRPDSLTAVYAEKFFEFFNQKSYGNAQLLNLEDLPKDLIHSGMYLPDKQSTTIVEMQDKFILGADAFFFIAPEYNGSIPGILKTFIDAISIRKYADNFEGKKVGIFGLAAGRAGNLRGIDHLTGIMNHVGCTVMPMGMAYGQAQKFVNEDKEIVDEGTLKLMEEYADRFLAFVTSMSKST